MKIEIENKHLYYALGGIVVLGAGYLLLRRREPGSAGTVTATPEDRLLSSVRQGASAVSDLAQQFRSPGTSGMGDYAHMNRPAPAASPPLRVMPQQPQQFPLGTEHGQPLVPFPSASVANMRAAGRMPADPIGSAGGPGQGQPGFPATTPRLGGPRNVPSHQTNSAGFAQGGVGGLDDGLAKENF